METYNTYIKGKKAMKMRLCERKRERKKKTKRK